MYQDFGTPIRGGGKPATDRRHDTTRSWCCRLGAGGRRGESGPPGESTTAAHRDWHTASVGCRDSRVHFVSGCATQRTAGPGRATAATRAEIP